MESTRVEKSGFVHVGVDFGGDSCRVSVVDKNDKICLHVNRVSNRQTPTLMAFDKRLRIYGEEAEARSSTLFKNSIPLLPYIVGLNKEELAEFVKSRKYLFCLELDEGTGSFKVIFDDCPLQVYPVEAFSFYLNKVLETVRNEFNLDQETGNQFIRLSLSVPNYFSDNFKKNLRKSLSLSGFKNVLFFRESECILKRWADSQLPDAYHEFLSLSGRDKDDSEKVPMKVAFLDVGLVHTTFFVAEVTSEDSALSAKILAEASSDTVGTYHVVESLCEYIRELVYNVSKVRVEVPSRQSYYLYKSCVKCVKELSVLNDAKLDVERVLDNDEDYTTNVTRTKLEQLVQPTQERLCSLIEGVLSKTDRENYLSIEILGGGSRIPFVKNLANHYADSLKCLRKTRTSLDTTSAVSYGATQLNKNFYMAQDMAKMELDKAENDTDSKKEVEGVDSEKMDVEVEEEEDLSEFLEKEKLIRNVEKEQTLKMTTLNEIDNFLYKTRSDLTGNYKNLVEGDGLGEVEQVLENLQEFSSEAMNDKTVDSKTCQDTLKNSQEKLKSLAPKYFKQLEEDRLKNLQDQRETNNYSSNYKPKEVDMDVVLPNKTCIKRAQKNKEEGNELIGAGNVELAIQHYVKVIQYCAKVSNPSEEEKSTINDLRLASNLNLAMCYLKLDVPASLNKAVSCCTSALSISPTNTKALFRRAVAYEKLNDFDNALKDANAGVELDSQNQDFKKMCDRVEKKIKLQVQKQKKVFSKMFA